MWNPYLTLPLLLWPLAWGYSYRNCMELSGRESPGSFQCVHRFLSRVSAAVSDLPANASHLNVSYNRIQTLSPGDFSRLPRLLTLRLDFNWIREIGPGALDNLTGLLTLNLSFNIISRLGRSDFLGLVSLTDLLLQHNRLSALDPGSLAPLANLQDLVLHNNRLSDFSQLTAAVSDLSRLARLELGRNRLVTLRPSPASLPPSLRVLGLSANSLVSLDARPGLLARVAVLDLSDNRLGQAADFSRPDLRGVRWLVVSGNPLNVSAFLASAWLDPRRVDYSGLGLRGQQGLADLCRHPGPRTMRRLVLRDNHISHLGPGYLNGCPTILEWDLSRNNLTSVGCLQFDSRRGGVSFTIEHNRIKSLYRCPGAVRGEEALRPNLGPGLGPNLGPGISPNLGPGISPNLGPGLGQNLGPGLSQNLSPGLSPNLGPGLSPNLGPGIGPNLGPGLSPNLGPGLSPNLSPGLGPNLGPGLGPNLGPGLGPNLGPGLSPNLGPGLSPNLGPGLSPNLGPGLSPNLGPGLSPNLSPNLGPGLSPNLGPGLGPGLSPNLGPGLGPNLGPGLNPGLGPGPGLFPNLTFLSFRYNRIFTIYPGAFAHAPALRTLLLNVNNVAVLKRGAFSGLPALRLLRLDNNLITDVYADTFRRLPSLRRLNLRNNRISVIFGGVFSGLARLEILDLGGNKISRLGNESFRGLAGLTKLYLDGNYIGRVDRGIFAPLPGLGVLDLARNLIRYNSAAVVVSPFLGLSKLRHLKLQAQQPYGINIVPPGFFDGLVALQSLYIGGNKMSLAKDVFKDLSNLTELSMPDACNGVHSLGPGVFRNLQNLEGLDLENTGLQSMSLDMVGNLSSLRVLLLAKNAIEAVPRTVLEHLPALSYLDVRKNPFTCTCRNTWFLNWSLADPDTQVVYFYNNTCAEQPDEYLYRFDARVCYQDLGKLVFQATFPLLLAFIVFPIVYANGYWHLKYGLYILRSWLSDLRAREARAGSYKFDAFVSYNSLDEEWVLSELVPALEADGGPRACRLCLHHRDFEPGKYIVDNIVDSIYQSRKTICVVSRAYLGSEWCSMELQLASYRLFHELKDVLVLVFLEHIPQAELSAYHKMRKVVKKRTYLQWPTDRDGQKLFWVKVRDAIRGPNAPEEISPSVGPQ
ncbi:LOW QUALITY PROTEIN: toll-like receptor 13 [Leucoraja erinacea]|uniref:LOW QUALITY PROTEIN: toll-like receptor 13 n=1 Tax=Leucoraja erinaceus TaxID=7782 RepID=UPI002453F656|nr:LOW QUALITY PROTEIN: toll-like receptor 13 [Leucoraja erinacea]